MIHDKVAMLDSIQHFFAAYATHDIEGISTILSPHIEWSIPGRHPLSGTKHGVKEVLAFFDALAKASFEAEPIFLEASGEYVVDIHRGWSNAGIGSVNTLWALIWHFDRNGKVDKVVNLSGDQAQMDTYCWNNFELASLPVRLKS